MYLFTRNTCVGTLALQMYRVVLSKVNFLILKGWCLSAPSCLFAAKARVWGNDWDEAIGAPLAHSDDRTSLLNDLPQLLIVDQQGMRA